MLTHKDILSGQTFDDWRVLDALVYQGYFFEEHCTDDDTGYPTSVFSKDNTWVKIVWSKSDAGYGVDITLPSPKRRVRFDKRFNKRYNQLMIED